MADPDRTNLLVREQVENEVISIPPTPIGQQTPGAFTPTGRWSPSRAAGTASTSGIATPHGAYTPTGNGTYTPTGTGTGPYTPRGHFTPTSTGPATPSRIPKSPRFLRSPKVLFSPIGTPMRKALTNMKTYLEDVGHLTKLNPQDAWLPITASRNGNPYYAAFHNLNAGIGFQVLALPLALTYLGWTWGVLALAAAFIWQFYTLWILIQLHEAVPGKRHSRYLELAQEAFGERLGSWLAIFPILNLSAGTATSLVILGGGTLELFFKSVCQDCRGQQLTTVEWYLVFTVLCAVLAHLPNLNSIAGVSFIGAVTAVAYTTMTWALSISKPRPPGVSYNIVRPSSSTATAFSVFNALGNIAFAFRGHNLVLEIQGTMPSSLKHPAKVPMWRGAKAAYATVAFCYFPIAIAGYWAYGDKMLPNGILASLYVFHRDVPSAWVSMTFLLFVLNSIGSFQIYSMPIFDSFEQGYTAKRNKPTPWYVRHAFRTFFTFFSFFIAVAIPFISSFGGLLGGLSTIPVTFCYPCFMWLRIKKPEKYSFMWYLNWFLGILGAVLAVLFSAGGIWSIVDTGLKFNFFNP